MQCIKVPNSRSRLEEAIQKLKADMVLLISKKCMHKLLWYSHLYSKVELEGCDSKLITEAQELIADYDSNNVSS